MLRKFGGPAAAALIYISAGVSANGQSPAEVTSTIDWDAAKADAENIAPAQKESLNSFRAANAVGVDAINVPVLVPGIGPVRAGPRLRGQGASYAAVYMLNAAKLSVLGTARALVPPSPERFASAAASSDGRVFEQGEDGADLSFIKYGASYILRLSCAKLDDERCIKDSFLNSVADSLVPVGGSKP
ncbi:hypothetical protein [Bradyrhizobium sp.]|jgi:hypothetical protein|uniref:hypothetical protein n=1 Tax=Bradyrhizobium sp. TaxID=376 RepID=UPI002E047EC6|nr:hypothetical protein [Bradyrhizobium sp.]